MRKKYIYSICCLISVFVVFGLIGGSRVFAACSENDGIVTCEGGVAAYVRVPAACSFTRASGSGNYNKTLANNTTITIKGSTFNTICNDTEGYAIYAIGFSGFEAGNTDLMAATVGSEYNIKTNGTGSNWKMKLSAGGNVTPTIENDFEDYQNIPADYTKIASYNSSVSMQEVSSITASYQVTASDVQPADNYSGKVLYLLVHPMSVELADVEQAFYNNGKEKYNGYYKMQDMNPTICSQIAPMSEAELIDIRDDKTYWVAKLVDGNCWMTQNLDHDIVTTENFYTPLNTDIPGNWTAARATYSDATKWIGGINTVLESYDPGERCWNGSLTFDRYGDLDNMTVLCTDSSANKHYALGNYYNWNAAIAVNNLSSQDYLRENVNQSICPAGWKLPHSSYYSDYNKSYRGLVTSLSLTAGVSGNIQNDPVYFVYGGYVSQNGTLEELGYSGQYSGSYGSNGNAVGGGLDFEIRGGGLLNNDGGGVRRQGSFVRCVAR